MGAMEARNYLLAEKPFKTDAFFQYVDARIPHKRRRMLKTGKQFNDLPDNSTDIFHGNLLGNWYPSRPDNLEDMSLIEFVQTYSRANVQDVKSTSEQKKNRLITLKNDQGYMIKRLLDPRHPYPPIVYGPTYLDPVLNKEEFYYSHLVLHVPWREESQLLGKSRIYEVEFNRLKDSFPGLAESVKKTMRRRRM